jgi:hypothetical protein
MKPTKADLKFANQLNEVIKGFHRRVGKEMCPELHSDCFDCQTRWTIGVLNHWIDLLEWETPKKPKCK